MAAAEPSPDDIALILAICNIERHQAVTLLKKYHTTDAAAANYFDDPNGSLKVPLPANQWEPSDNLPSFRIDADDTPNLSGMSRPPSRIDDRGVFDDGATGVGGQFNQLDDAQDDDELRRAIAMSREEMPGQESGVTTTGQQFGPAIRSHYNPGDWAMTAISSSREVIEHPPPSKRQRVSGQPAFLRGSPETGYLAPLLNIYHSIPLARQALLLPSFKVLTFGYDPTWWTGTSDENSKSVSVQVSDTSSRDRENLLAEIQTLMAFLDDTKRAYGSVDALADLNLFKNTNPETPLSRLLEVWVDSAMQQVREDPLTQIFASAAVKDPHVQGVDYERKQLCCLEAPVNTSLDQTLVDLLDLTIWNDTITNIDDVWIDYCAEVFTMRLHDPRGKGNGLGLKIPAVWYPDRYMYNYRGIAREMRIQLVELRKQINHCMFIQRKCESAPALDKRMINIREVLQAASKLSTDPQINNVELGTSAKSGEDGNTPEADSILFQLEAQMQLVLQRIDEKVKILEARKLELQNKMREISSTLSTSIENSTSRPRSKYVLQGVSTKPYITYVRHRQPAAPDLIDFGEPSGIVDEWQWWKIAWHQDEPPSVPSIGPRTQAEASQQQSKNSEDPFNQSLDDQLMKDESKPYSIRKVGEAEVLEAAKTENDSVLLVYAHQDALDFQTHPTSLVLKKLIEQDNRAFQQEMIEEQGLSKRRSSIDTNTTIMDNIALDDDGDLIRETTPMSTASPPRGLDGQASPKRAKMDGAYFSGNGFNEDPPPYEPAVQMQERKANKIGLLADQMMERVDNEAAKSGDDDSGPVRIEHASTPLR